MKDHLVKFNMTLTGEVNGSPLLVAGDGKYIEDAGALSGSYEMVNMPEGMSHRILDAFLITGHNACSENVQGTTNPFRPFTHSYTRVCTFTDGNRLTLNANCVRNGDTIDSDFKLFGTVGNYNLVSTEPLVDIWVPRGKGKLYGNFTIAWITDTGHRLVGETSSNYNIVGDSELTETLHRFVTIQSQVDGKHLDRYQQVTLWRSFPGHKTPEEANELLQRISSPVKQASLA